VTDTLLLVLALPLIAIALALAASLAVASFRSPVAVLLSVFAVIVPVGSLVEIPLPLPPPFNTPSSVVGAVAIAALIVHLIGERLAGGERRSPWIPAAVAWWLGYAAIASLSLLWSVNPQETIAELSILVSLVALYVLAAFAVTTPEDLRRFEFAIVLGGLVAAGYAVLLLVSAGLPRFGGTTPRFAASGGVEGEAGPNETAAALLLPLALAAGKAVDPEAEHRGRWMLAAGLIAIAIALTASRGGLLSMGVVLMIVAWQAGRIRIVGYAATAALAALLIVPTFGAEALQQRLFKQSSSGRTLIWKTALKACDRHCVTGSGYGTFPDVYNEAIGVSAQITGQRLRKRAHNIWVRAGIETGLAGLIALSGALYLQWSDLGRIPRPFRGPPLAGFVGVLTANIFLSNIGFKYFWLAMIHAMLTTVVWRRAPAAARASVEARAAPAAIGLRRVPA
jgi:O-antigen ligase